MTAQTEAIVDLATPATPPGWDRLPAGVIRSVRVERTEVGDPDGRPVHVSSVSSPWGEYYAGAVIEGPSRMVHVPAGKDEVKGCTERGHVRLETTASILVCKLPAALVALAG